MSKYRLTDKTIEVNGRTLHRIRAVRDIGAYVKKGSLGGWIESERNLSQSGDCWVSDGASVYGCATVCDDALVCGHAQVRDNAKVGGSAKVYGGAEVYGNAKVYDSEVGINARVCGNAQVRGFCEVHGSAKVYGDAEVFDNTIVFDNAAVYGHAQVFDGAEVFDNADVCGNAKVGCFAKVCDEAEVCGGTAFGPVCIRGDARIENDADYTVLRNSWSSGRWITYTRSNRMWNVGCFLGTGEQLIEKAYKDGDVKGRCYEAIVRAVEQIGDEAIMAGLKKEKP